MAVDALVAAGYSWPVIQDFTLGQIRAFARVTNWRQAQRRYLDALAMRAAFADDPKYLRDWHPGRLNRPGPDGREARPARSWSVLDQPEDELAAHLAEMGFILET